MLEKVVGVITAASEPGERDFPRPLYPLFSFVVHARAFFLQRVVSAYVHKVCVCAAAEVVAKVALEESNPTGFTGLEVAAHFNDTIDADTPTGTRQARALYLFTRGVVVNI